MRDSTAVVKRSVVAAFVAITGCASDHLIFTTYTKVGLDVSTTNGQMVNGLLGYKRFEGAIIPVDPAKDAASKEAEVASVFAGIAIRNSWLDGLDIAQVFGTGVAAENLVNAASPALQEVLSLGAPPEEQPGKQTKENE